MDLNLIFPVLIEWWPLFFFAAILWLLGQIIKKVIPKPTKSVFWRYYWITLSLHPIIAGGLFGSLTGAPVPTSVKSIGTLAGPLFYAGSGFIASQGHKLWRAYLEYKKLE